MSEVILKAIQDLGTETKSQVEAAEKKANELLQDEVKKMAESKSQLEADLKNEIKAVKDEADKLKEQVTELNKKGSRIAAKVETKSFNEVLKEAVEEKTDDFKKMAAGEKSSAYLSGRAVKVCKGQMKG